MKSFFSILLLTTLLLTSCSSTKVSRHVANEIHPEAKEAIESLFTIKASNITLAEEDLEKKVLANLKTFIATAEIKIELIEDEHLTNEVLFKIEPGIENNKNLITIRYAEDAFRDHVATLNLTRFMDGLLQSNFPSPYTFFELYHNAINNDPSALYTVAKIRRSVLTPLTSNTYYEPVNLSQYNGYVQGETIIWDRKLAELAKIEKKKNAEKRKVIPKKAPETSS